MITVNTTDWTDLNWSAFDPLFDRMCEGLPFDIMTTDLCGDIKDDDGDYDLDCVWEWIHEACEVLASLEDRWGGDDIFLLPSGHVMFYDRNSGSCDYTSTPVDVELFKTELTKVLASIKETADVR